MLGSGRSVMYRAASKQACMHICTALAASGTIKHAEDAVLVQVEVSTARRIRIKPG